MGNDIKAAAGEADERAKREADRGHKARVLLAVYKAFVAQGLLSASAKLAISAIADGKIPGVVIHY